MSSPAIEFSEVVKDYHALRPLRVKNLAVREGEIVALAGPDLGATEALTNLVTGASVPDHGTVRVFGADTKAIADADEWLSRLDRLGIVSPRVALLDGFTVEQNIALPLTIDLDPVPPDIAATARSLAAEVGLADDWLPRAAGAADAATAVRVRLARAAAPAPRLLLVEHPTGTLTRPEVANLVIDFRRLVRSHHLTALVVTADDQFARAADRRLILDAATGIARPRGLRGWLA